MFEIELKVLAENSGTSKKSGNAYRLVTVRTKDGQIMNLRVAPNCPQLADYVDEEVTATISLTAYQMSPNLSLVNVK